MNLKVKTEIVNSLLTSLMDGPVKGFPNTPSLRLSVACLRRQIISHPLIYNTCRFSQLFDLESRAHTRPKRPLTLRLADVREPRYLRGLRINGLEKRKRVNKIWIMKVFCGLTCFECWVAECWYRWLVPLGFRACSVPCFLISMSLRPEANTRAALISDTTAFWTNLWRRRETNESNLFMELVALRMLICLHLPGFFWVLQFQAYLRQQAHQ